MTSITPLTVSENSAFTPYKGPSGEEKTLQTVLSVAFSRIVTFGECKKTLEHLKNYHKIIISPEILGKGTSGSVIKGVLSDSKKEVAIKVFHSFKSGEEEKQHNNEVYSLDPFHSLKALDYFKIGFNDHHTSSKAEVLSFFSTEFGGISFYDYYLSPQKQGDITFDEIKSFVVQFIQFAEIIENKGYVLGDIRPENILIFGKDLRKPGSLKFIDLDWFGKIDEETTIPCYRGTRPYRSPEMITEKYGYSESRVALACIFYELLTSKILFKTEIISGEPINHKIQRHLNLFFLVTNLPSQAFFDKLSQAQYENFFDDRGCPKQNFQKDENIDFKKNYKAEIKNQIRCSLDEESLKISKEIDKDKLSEEIYDFIFMLLDYNDPKSFSQIYESRLLKGFKDEIDKHTLYQEIETTLSQKFSQLTLT